MSADLIRAITQLAAVHSRVLTLEDAFAKLG